MIRIQQLKLPVTHTQEELEQKIRKTLKIGKHDLQEIELLRRSIDARKKSELKYVYQLDVKVKEKYNNNPELAIIDENQQVHMARIDMHYGFSVNGVAALHTEILKNSELKPFYDIYPNKFNNKTNGITFRRWLLHSNHELTGLISSKIGDGFKKDANELEKLMQFKDLSLIHI